MERYFVKRANKSDVEGVTLGLDSITIDIPAASGYTADTSKSN